jgi:hypothetical protein
MGWAYPLTLAIAIALCITTAGFYKKWQHAKRQLEKASTMKHSSNQKQNTHKSEASK